MVMGKFLVSALNKELCFVVMLGHTNKAVHVRKSDLLS